MTDESEKLSPRQLQFILYFLASGHGTKSYQLAYGEERPEVAAPGASRLLKHPAIKAHIDAIKAAAITKSTITTESIIARINALADGAASERDRLRALELLGKHLGVFVTDKDLVAAMSPQQLEELAERMLAKVNGQRHG